MRAPTYFCIWPMKSYLLLAGTLVLLGGCSPREGRSDVGQYLVMQTDFEAPTRALPDSIVRSLTANQVHSGSNALLLDWAHKSSGNYSVPLSSLFKTRPRKLHFSTWTWVQRHEDDATVTIAVSAPNDPKSILAQKTVYLADEGPYEEWKEVSVDLDIPFSANQSSQLLIYARHNLATEPVYLDDWKVFEIR
jgi:hypothetical protein